MKLKARGLWVAGFRNIPPSQTFQMEIDALLSNGISFFLVGLLILVAGILWRKFRKMQLAARKRLALSQFDELRKSLEDLFLQKATATGKPRGLRWLACELQGAPLFAIDPTQDTLFALVATTIRFEAIEGGDMEEVEAVGNLRSATSVFIYYQDHWTTDGRAVFNLGPVETCERFQLDSYPRMQ